MFRFTGPIHSRTYISAHSELNAAFLALSISMCTGAIAAVCSNETDAMFDLRTAISNASQLRTVLAALCFHVLAFMLGSSYFGFCLLPLLSAAFGFFQYCQAASAFKALSGAAFRELLAFVIPTLLLVPCFFVIAVEAFAASRRLNSFISRRGVPIYSGRPLHFLLCVPFLALAALALCFFGGL